MVVKSQYIYYLTLFIQHLRICNFCVLNVAVNKELFSIQKYFLPNDPVNAKRVRADVNYYKLLNEISIFNYTVKELLNK